MIQDISKKMFLKLEETWSQKRPSIQHVKVFGCISYVHVPPYQLRKKLDKEMRVHEILHKFKGT